MAPGSGVEPVQSQGGQAFRDGGKAARDQGEAGAESSSGNCAHGGSATTAAEKNCTVSLRELSIKVTGGRTTGLVRGGQERDKNDNKKDFNVANVPS